MGTILYLICFERPFGHARHYLGYTKDQESFPLRIQHHRRGTGANLLRHVNLAGIAWNVVRTWPDGDQTMERRLKGHSSTRLCPKCSPEGAWRRARTDFDRSIRSEIEDLVSGGEALS